ncbi:methyltransferase domain-containing protein [Candidatus Uhrbacteria bacterium]|nr:methyltransferase domain-containing protein [Candidatus Uhrbacteria bacterium]
MNDFSRSDYDKVFFDSIKDGSLSSAKIIVPKIIDVFQPKNVIDVGCGTGSWLSVFEAAGIDIFGVDGGSIDESQLLIPRDKYVSMDVSSDIHFDRTFDIALCLEVAEHLPPEKSEKFIGFLASLAPIVIFSAAIPGQGGTNHINEQWPIYWIELFSAHSFDVLDIFRTIFWDNQDIEPWYRQNLFAFVSKKYPHFSHNHPASGQISALVHPEIFSRRVDSIITEKDSIITEKDSIITEKDSIIANCNAHLDYIAHSFSWKVTKPLRYLKRLTRL